MKINYKTHIILLFMLFSKPLWAVDMEPRRWSHLPAGSNIIGIATVHSNIDISFDPVLKIEEGEAEADTLVVSYLHSFDFLGKTARLDFRQPYQSIKWKGLLDGEARSISREGLGDPLIRLSVNFIGAPALTGETFRSYRSTHKTNTVVGAALGVVVPLGQYKKNKLLNIGQNRYVIRPQLGFVHTRNSWSYEVTGTINFYTDNNDFWGNNKREQKVLSSLQSHIVHTFKNRIWGSISAAYDWGGETTINGIDKDDKKENYYFAISSGYPISRTSSIKLAYIGGRTQKNLGIDSDRFILGFSTRF